MKHPLPRLSVLITLALLGGCSEPVQEQRRDPELFTVRRESLRISVEEEGEMRAFRETKVKSEVEGSATVIYLVPEGKVVEKGEKLVELDASELIERRANQEINLERARAAKVQAEQNLEIQMKEIRAAEETARSALTVAGMEFEKFLGKAAIDGAPTDRVQGTNQEMLEKLSELVQENPELTPLYNKVSTDLLTSDDLHRDMGQLAQDILTAIDAVRLAVADLKIKDDKLFHSKRLREQEYITRTDLERDQYERDSSNSKVTLEKNKLDILINYTLKTSQIQLRQDVSNADLELEKVMAQNEARKTREEADFKAKEAEYNLAKERFENLENQINNSVIYSPTPGLVVYATQGDGRRGRETIEEGLEVRERQNLIVLPDVSRMVCDIKVQEADIDKVLVGQRASVTVDAFPDRSFTGVVSFVSSLPDSGNRWSNSDKKVYKTTILLDGENDVLRPGVSAKVEIVIREVADALIVPKQAVRRSGAVQYVWRAGAGEPQAVPVNLGESNLSHVQVLDPLKEGDQVFLAPPRGVIEPKFEQPEQPARPAAAPSANPAEATASTGSGERTANPAADERGSTDVRALMTQLRDKLREALPDHEGLKQDRGWFMSLRDPEVTAAIEADPELKSIYEKFSSMRGQRGQRGRRGRGGDAPGEQR